ncbi:MAG: IS21 family transposase, partial [Clostridiales bacterium]|nr:IS21 family transposase [Clostridiales bacterium]
MDRPPAYAQVDFGDFKHYVAGGASHEGHALIASLPYSNSGWMQVFPSENQECPLEGMKRIFYHIGGVPIRVRCGNMPTAAAHVLKGTERAVTDGFSRFKPHHRLLADFCSPSGGNEKGGVESEVGHALRNMLAPVPTIDGFDAFNKELTALCDADQDRGHCRRGDTLKELWEEDGKYLLALPEYEREAFRCESPSVGKTGFAAVGKRTYGLSPEHNGKRVQAKIYFDRIQFFYEN